MMVPDPNAQSMVASFARQPEAEDTLPSDAGRPPAIDRDLLFKHSMGNRSLALALLGELEASGNQRVNEIAILAVSNDLDATAEAAHSLKGAAGIIGAESLFALATDLEATGRRGQFAEVIPLIGELRQEMIRCLGQIPSLREQIQETAT